MSALRRSSPALLVAAGVVAAACGGSGDADADAAYRLDQVFHVEGLERPESVAWDDRRDRWLVASAGREDRSGSGGSVTAVSARGDTVRRLWSGPDAEVPVRGPRGLAVAGDTAWIAGAAGLAAVDLVGDSVLFRVRPGEADRLDDVVRADDGSLFVSHADGNAVWRVEPDGAGTARHPPVGSLRGPDGLLVEGTGGAAPERVLVAGAEGAVLALNPDSSVALLAESPRFGRLDGLQRAPDGGLVVGDRGTGRLHHLRRRSPRVWRTGRPWLTGLSAPADFVIRDSLLALPESGAHRLTVYRITAP